MLAIQSGIANHHCFYTQGGVALQTPGVIFYSPGISFLVFMYENSYGSANMVYDSKDKLGICTSFRMVATEFCCIYERQ